MFFCVIGERRQACFLFLDGFTTLKSASNDGSMGMVYLPTGRVDFDVFL